MPIPSSGVPQKKSKVYVDRGGESFLQVLPEIYCESEILPESYYPVSSFALAQWKDGVEMALQPFSGATATAAGAPGTVPAARPEDRGSYLRGDGTWGKIEITDNKVRNVVSNTTKFYITGTGQNSTNTGTQYFDTYVYVSGNAGELVAKKFIGNLKGNVEGDLDGTATSAITDGDGNDIAGTYATKTEVASAMQSHKHTSADVNKLTGYSKGTASNALSASDTLNGALSKLEVRFDTVATLNSPAFTGTPTTPTPTKSGNVKQVANREYVDSAISSLVNGAGSALDTLGELARALNNDPNFASSITTALAGKLAANSAGYVKALSISDTTTGQNLTVQYGNNSTNVLAIKDTKYTAATAAPKAPASTAAVGTSVKYAREDHVHPLQTTISGKAETAGKADKADKLTTPRKLRANLAATADATFDGSVDQLNIPVAGVLPVAHGGTGANTLNGLVQTGNVNQTIGGTKTFSNKITGSISGNAGSADVSAKTTGTPAGTTWVAGATSGKALVNSTATSFGAILNASTKNYKVAMSTYPSNTDLVYLYSVTNANVSNGTNTVAKSLTWNAATGELTADSIKSSSGTISGKATSAGTADTATSATKDGNGNVIASTYLPLAGGTVTGTLNLTRTTDAQGTGSNAPALRIGALTGAHLELDGDELMAKASGNTVGTLYLNRDGGLVSIGSGGLTVAGKITGNLKGDVEGTCTTAKSCTGNAATATSATKDGNGNVIASTYLPLAGGTVTGTLNLTRTTDAQGTGSNAPALRIGSLTGSHLEFDGNEIMAKASGNTTGPLYINADGGLVSIGGGGLTVSGTITGNLKGNVTGNVTGNASTASKFASAQTVALTGDVTGSASSQGGWSIATTLSNSGVTAGSYGPSDNATPTYGATFNVPYITVDKKGRVTAASTKTVKIPSSNDTDTKVNVKLGTTTKAYLLGTSTTPTTTAVGVTAIADTGVYLDTTAGKLTAKTFDGNATSATKLATPRNLYINLGAKYDSTNPVTFDGSAAKALPVSGILSVANGGTGNTTLDGAGIVTKSGAQTITGTKIFSSYVVCTRENPSFEGMISTYKKGNSIASNGKYTAGMYVHDSQGNYQENSRFSAVSTNITSDKTVSVNIAAYKDVLDSTDCGILSIICPVNGNPYATCPNPPTTASESSQKIVTTEWIRFAQGNTSLKAAGLATPRNLYVKLNSAYNSDNPVTFDGTAAKALPVTGVLPVANGGTGTNSIAGIKTALGLGSAAYTASTAYAAASHTHNYLPTNGTAAVASKLGTTTVGGTAKPIYLNAGTATACSSTVGGASQIMYMSNGTMTAGITIRSGTGNPASTLGNNGDIYFKYIN